MLSTASSMLRPAVVVPAARVTAADEALYETTACPLMLRV